MSFKVTKITVGKGRTIGDEKAAKWEREYFELEAQVEDESGIELAKGSLESLIDVWLKGETIAPREKRAQRASEDVPADLMSMIWKPAAGPKGPFEIAESTANVNNASFSRLGEYLAKHEGRAIVTGYFVWKFADASGSIGRKHVEKQA